MNFQYFDELEVAITVCNREGLIVYMNRKSVQTFAEDGGSALVGKSLLDCHPEPARSKLVDLLANPRRNVYTIEKNGLKKMIYQLPWTEDGKFKGLIEFSLPLPEEILHFVRG
jgi:transcriptional regulator with PAS, ATPase and Fis domain